MSYSTSIPERERQRIANDSYSRWWIDHVTDNGPELRGEVNMRRRTTEPTGPAPIIEELSQVGHYFNAVTEPPYCPPGKRLRLHVMAADFDRFTAHYDGKRWTYKTRRGFEPLEADDVPVWWHRP